MDNHPDCKSCLMYVDSSTSCAKLNVGINSCPCMKCIVKCMCQCGNNQNPNLICDIYDKWYKEIV